MEYLHPPLSKRWGVFVRFTKIPFARTVLMDAFFLQYEKELRALANRRRLCILFYLKRRESACVLDIAENLEVSFKTASKHLGRLFAAGLLIRNQRGGEMHYRIVEPYPSYLRPLLERL